MLFRSEWQEPARSKTDVSNILSLPSLCMPSSAHFVCINYKIYIHIFITSVHCILYPITSHSLCLPQSSFRTSCQYYTRISWFSACWSLYLEFHPSLLIIDLSTLALPSNPVSTLNYSLLQASLAYHNSIRAILIRHFHADFSVAITLHYLHPSH